MAQPLSPHLPQVRFAFDCATSVPFGFLSPEPAARIVTLGVSAMDYEIDLCPAHSVIRLTVIAEAVSNKLA